MQCNECKTELGNQIDNEHLFACCGLTLQEYALRHHLPLDLLLNADQVNQKDNVASYLKPTKSFNQQVQDVLAGLYMADAIQQQGEFYCITLGIRRLEQLLWYQKVLHALGFQFKQEYFYENDSHRVVAKNFLKVPSVFLPPRIVNSSGSSFLQQIAVLIAHIGELHAGYLFVDFPKIEDAQRVGVELAKEYQIRLKPLAASEYTEGQLMRCETLEDTTRLVNLLSEYLQDIPNACERFFEQHEKATVVKELVFDSAHFITDHPDKCENLHGGRYAMNVKVKDHIDPLTGFVLDYGYLKRIAKEKIVNELDHHNLNYVAAELSWRSSTELLNIFIWEKLIEYLPGLTELQIYETSQSHCTYKGPSLDEMQKKGQSALLRYFVSDELGKSQLRNILSQSSQRRLKAIG
ncbi:MAG: 6-carboxytetrahydropterin synthase [Gammaproteobacteria bacterium]|nr:MAG: 6-carboxytetrahydropterin synthase [Gammaproteobacteria bacterium]